MNIKKLIFFGVILLVILASLFFVVGYTVDDNYDVKQIAVESKDLVFYSNDKPVNKVVVDKRVPKGTVVDENETVQVWIE